MTYTPAQACASWGTDQHPSVARRNLTADATAGLLVGLLARMAVVLIRLNLEMLSAHPFSMAKEMTIETLAVVLLATWFFSALEGTPLISMVVFAATFVLFKPPILMGWDRSVTTTDLLQASAVGLVWLATLAARRSAQGKGSVRTRRTDERL